MAKVLIDINSNDLAKLTDNDILMYDADKKSFYRMTPNVFFDKYEEKLNSLLERYDNQFKEMSSKYSEEFLNLKNDWNDVKKTMREMNEKSLNMVKDFINTH